MLINGAIVEGTGRTVLVCYPYSQYAAHQTEHGTPPG